MTATVGAPFPDDAAAIVAKLVAARRSGQPDIERNAAHELRQRFGIKLTFASETNQREVPVGIDAESPSNSLLIDAREAARRLAVSPRTLWALTKCGSVPHVQVGRRVLYDPRDLAQWIDGQRSGGPVEHS